VVNANINPDPSDPYPSTIWFNAWWQNSITAPDHCARRVAFALSEIMVISENGALVNDANALASYYDVLVTNAFGNFRTLLEAVTLHPSMGIYLTCRATPRQHCHRHPRQRELRARNQPALLHRLNREWPTEPWC